MHPDWTLSPCTTSETRKLETCQDTVQAYLLSTSLLRAYAICFPAFTTRFTRQLTCQDVDSYMLLHSLPRHQTPSYPSTSR